MTYVFLIMVSQTLIKFLQNNIKDCNNFIEQSVNLHTSIALPG
jgi:hypothetical protein